MKYLLAVAVLSFSACSLFEGKPTVEQACAEVAKGCSQAESFCASLPVEE